MHTPPTTTPIPASSPAASPSPSTTTPSPAIPAAPSSSSKFTYPFPVRLRIHSSCKPPVTPMIVSIVFALVIILVIIAAIFVFVRRIGIITIEFAIKMEGVTIKLQAILTSY